MELRSDPDKTKHPACLCLGITFEKAGVGGFQQSHKERMELLSAIWKTRTSSLKKGRDNWEDEGEAGDDYGNQEQESQE